MRIVNLALLASFAHAGRCECCGKHCRKREGHHIFSRGAGRLDIEINLISLGSTALMQCPCHRNASKIGKDAFLVIVAKREGLSVDVIVAAIYCLRHLPKPANWSVEKLSRTKSRSAWAERAGELRRAAARAAYRRAKDWRKNRNKLEVKGTT